MIGCGTFGIVYSCTSPKTNKEYVIKRNLSETDTSFIKVVRETDILNRLRGHPHISKLEKVSFGNPFENICFSPLVGQDRVSQKDDNLHFILGKADYDLHKYIYQIKTVNFSTLKRYMVHILLGCEYIHLQYIIHRDLKPSNILIYLNETDSIGNIDVAKICDFGLSKPYTYQGYQTPNTVTSWYRAPEIALCNPYYDYKSDIWSLGCILFEMIARKSLISDIPDDNDEIISSILSILPIELPVRKMRELIRGNKWRKVELKPTHNPRIRRNFKQQIGFNEDGIKLFEQQCGNFDIFNNLLENMLQFEPEKRFGITEVLNHQFFSEHRKLISETRKHRAYSYLNREVPINITKCIERKWMSKIVVEIFNNRTSLYKWYSHRALFQAMSLFDDYLSITFKYIDKTANVVESQHKGLIHDKYGTELRFITCLYLSIKYFSTLHFPISFNDITTEEYHTEESLLIAEQFEGGFIKNYLKYNIYRPTLYEVSDGFGEYLDDVDIRNLILLYSTNDDINGFFPSELYKYYRENLRGKPIETLYNPIKIKPISQNIKKEEV